jgi:hypothetical protein
MGKTAAFDSNEANAAPFISKRDTQTGTRTTLRNACIHAISTNGSSLKLLTK